MWTAAAACHPRGVDCRVRAELYLPHHRITVRTLDELPAFGDELDVDGVTFTVADVREEDGLLPLVVLAGVIGPPVLVGAGAGSWAHVPETVA
jgi:hypothetical protein